MPTTTTTVTSATASGAIATVTTTVAIPEAKAVLGEVEEEKEEEEDVEESSSTTYDCPAASQVDEFGYKYVEFHGIVYPPFMVPGVVDEMRERCHLRGGKYGDIVIATFPKCGTTWMQQIVVSLLAGSNKAKYVKDPMALSPWAERECSMAARDPFSPMKSINQWISWTPNKQQQAVSPPRRVIKTHAPEQLSPWVGGTGAGLPTGSSVIVVTRNPFDTAVSLFNHASDVPIFEYTGDFDHFLKKLFIPGSVEHGCYWAWQSAWWQAHQKHKDKILWISYEELKCDLRAGVEKVAKFCSINATDETVEAVCKGATFSSMKSTAAEVDAAKLAAGGKVKKNHIRQGKSGAWRKKFTEEQTALFMAHHKARCAELGIPDECFNFGDDNLEK